MARLPILLLLCCASAGCSSSGQRFLARRAQTVSAEPTQVSEQRGPGSGSDGVVISEAANEVETVDYQAATASPSDTAQPRANSFAINLPTALAYVDGQHPVVGQARWRVREAYAEFDAARALWLPSLRVGFSFHRHDGNYQASNGQIVDVNRNSFQYGLGDSANGAGTTQRPGLRAEFHLADAILQDDITRKTAWAQGHAASATTNRQLLEAALAYTELLAAHQDRQILQESQQRFASLKRITDDFAETGAGLQADARRTSAERLLNQSRLLESDEAIALRAARLARIISLPQASQLVPMDISIVPLDWGLDQDSQASLIATALSNRPELKESQALVSAACDAYRKEKLSPWLPSVLLGFSSGGFGGGLGNDLDNVDSRYDFDAAVAWQVRHLGFGEKAARKGSAARVQQAKFEKLARLDQVASEVAEAYQSVIWRRQRMDLNQAAIEQARESYRLNLERIRDGQGLPIEVLQSAQALEAAQRSYLRSVVDYNLAQHQLQWALGWPPSA
ncbi:MAG: TolC family protein [Planctomycetota bacterium]